MVMMLVCSQEKARQCPTRGKVHSLMTASRQGRMRERVMGRSVSSCPVSFGVCDEGQCRGGNGGGVGGGTGAVLRQLLGCFRKSDLHCTAGVLACRLLAGLCMNCIARSTRCRVGRRAVVEFTEDSAKANFFFWSSLSRDCHLICLFIPTWVSKRGIWSRLVW